MALNDFCVAGSGHSSRTSFCRLKSLTKLPFKWPKHLLVSCRTFTRDLLTDEEPSCSFSIPYPNAPSAHSLWMTHLLVSRCASCRYKLFFEIIHSAMSRFVIQSAPMNRASGDLPDITAVKTKVSCVNACTETDSMPNQLSCTPLTSYTPWTARRMRPLQKNMPRRGCENTNFSGLFDYSGARHRQKSGHGQSFYGRMARLPLEVIKLAHRSAATSRVQERLL